MLEEINYVRAHPQDYAEQLRDSEPTAATLQAIDDLQRRGPAQPLSFNPGLSLSAARHATDQGDHASFEHTGSDGSSAPASGMRRAGVLGGDDGRGDVRRPAETAPSVVRQLIVDEGVPGSGHRKDLMDPFLKQAGVGCAPHPEYGLICDHRPRFDARATVDTGFGTTSGPAAWDRGVRD